MSDKQPSALARGIANEIAVRIAGLLMGSETTGPADIESIASLIDQAIEDAVRPYREALEFIKRNGDEFGYRAGEFLEGDFSNIEEESEQ